MKKTPGAVFLILLLAGCGNLMKTMVAHHRLDEKQVLFIAKANAATNVCMSEKALDKSHAYEFSSIAAQVLDLTVFDQDFYKLWYEEFLRAIYAEKNSGKIASSCAELNRELPNLTSGLRAFHQNIARELGVARARENSDIAAAMGNFRRNSTVAYQPTFPAIQYKNELPKSQNFLIRTDSGLTQCRVTSSNFVFCL